MTEPGKDIVIAEDDFDDVVIFELAIAETGIPVVIRRAANAATLFDLLQEQLPAVLFLDVHMPCEDGMSCLMRIRKEKAYDHLPVIMLTASSSPMLINECYLNGASMYMQKSYTLAALAANITKVLNTNWAEYSGIRNRENFVLD